MYIYVASPYTDPDKFIMNDRYLEAMRYTADLIKNGQHAYSPIVHCHDMAIRYDFPVDHVFWSAFDAAMIIPCKEVHVLQLEGWDQSRGIAHEIEFCRLIQKKIRFARWDRGLEIYRLI